MRIVWTKRATRDLRAAYEYWMKEKSSTVELLEENPELGRSGRIASTRELVLKPLPFLLAYRTRHHRIEILALVHGARKWPNAFR